jgi:PAS domain S-box-containing protein
MNIMTTEKNDNDKTKAELLEELAKLQQQVIQLEESEKHYKAILETQGEGVVMVDTHETFIFSNPAAEKIFGVKSQQLLGRNLKEFLDPRTFPIIEEQSEKRRKGMNSTYELEILRSDSEKRTILLTVVPFFDDQKQFKGALSSFKDITEEKHSVEALKEQEDIIRAVIESSSDGILVVDKAKDYTHANNRFYEMWHIPEEYRHDKHLYYVANQFSDPQAFIAQVLALYQSPEDSFDTLFFKDGRVFERLSFPLRRKNEIAGRVWSFRDISERKRAEAEKKKLETQLQQSQKMEAIGALAGGIAHDFNNILGAILGYSELALDDTAMDSAARKNLELVLKASFRAKELVKQILTFSRKTEENRMPILLAEIIRESLKLLRALIPSTIDIRSHIQDSLKPVLANPTQMQQVFMNLCTNAASAMREKGHILEINLTEIEPDPGFLADRGMDPGLYQLLSVSDTGHGIPAEIIQRIFEPYFTTKKTGEGSGMGLAVVHGIVKGHGGEITVDSQPGKGTTFNVYLKVTGERKLPRRNTASIEPIPRGNEKIIFIDDEKDLVEIGARLLVNLGYDVVSATSSLEALEIFRNDPSRFDLVISDQTMPHLTGLQLAGQLKQIRPDLPVILCTGFSENIDELNYKSRGINDFLMKPIARNEMARVVRSVLDRNRRNVSK